MAHKLRSLTLRKYFEFCKNEMIMMRRVTDSAVQKVVTLVMKISVPNAAFLQAKLRGS